MKPRSFIISTAFLLVLLHSTEAANHAPWFGGPPKAQIINMQLPRTIKVSLLRSRHAVAIGCTGSYSYVSLKKGKPVTVNKKTILRIKGGRQGMLIGQKPVTGPLLISPVEPETYLTVNGRAYRGSFLVRFRGNGTVDVIEQVDLEKYLNGVLPREVGVDWPVESLKVQAVISRTYVVANLRKSTGKAYDVSSDVFSQVYGGLQDENPATTQAVEDTRGEILVDNQGIPVLTFFHSSCGGRTESPQYVWQEIKNPPNYLESVRDTYCKDDPFYTWNYEIGADALQRRLRHAGYKVGPIKNLSIGKTSPSGRAWTLVVESTKSKKEIPGNSFRLAVGPDVMRSTLLTTVKKRGKVFHFEGHGWGHGVGLCQWGARGRALAGETYQKIIDIYYPTVRLVKPDVTKAK